MSSIGPASWSNRSACSRIKSSRRDAIGDLQLVAEPFQAPAQVRAQCSQRQRPAHQPPRESCTHSREPGGPRHVADRSGSPSRCRAAAHTTIHAPNTRQRLWRLDRSPPLRSRASRPTVQHGTDSRQCCPPRRDDDGAPTPTTTRRRRPLCRRVVRTTQPAPSAAAAHRLEHPAKDSSINSSTRSDRSAGRREPPPGARQVGIGWGSGWGAVLRAAILRRLSSSGWVQPSHRRSSRVPSGCRYSLSGVGIWLGGIGWPLLSRMRPRSSRQISPWGSSALPSTLSLP